jgi:hypothetical protein
MAKARTPLVIGPFAGGLNLYDDPTAIQDTECVEALNFEPGLDGSLMSRPPFQDLSTPIPLGATGDATPLGVYYSESGLFYLLATDGVSKTYYYFGGTWNLITDTFAASGFAQYDGKAWLVAPVGEIDPGGSWTPAGGFVADADMPRGDVILSYNFRLWIARGKNATQGTRVHYSKVLGQPNFWQTPGFIDVGAGDGQSIVSLSIYYNALVIFRTRSIWTLQYVTDPAQATVQVLVPGVGLENKYCLVSEENYLYFFYDSNAYQFINNQVQQINVKVPFEAVSRSGIALPLAVSVFGKRILYSFYDTLYLYSLRTRTWTRWRSAQHGAIGKIVSPVSPDTLDAAYAMSSKAIAAGGSRSCPLLYIREDVAGIAEVFQCVLQTKNYNYELPSNFKRLFWWGVDAIFRGQVKGEVIPIVYASKPTWGQLRTAGVTWHQLLQGTWGSPLSVPLSVETAYNLNNLGPTRKFVKFKKGLRFRQLGFRLTFPVDGTTLTLPVYVFSLSAYIVTRENVVKAIS